MSQSVADRLFAKAHEDENGCWVFTGARSAGGYGFLRVAGKNLYTHRVAYEEIRAKIPDGLHLDHLCRNRSCINPWHLEPVTPRINTLRGDTFQARNAAKTHCIRGHELAGDNLRTDPTGRRICRECKRIQGRRVAR